MRLTKDKTQLRYNGFLTLGGIPAEAFACRLGNRSALEWVIVVQHCVFRNAYTVSSTTQHATRNAVSSVR